MATRTASSSPPTRRPRSSRTRAWRKYDVVVWLSTVGGVRGDPPLLTPAEWGAFQRYIEAGGGYAGIHAGSDCCDESAWYGELLGNQARFHSHPGGVGGSPGCIGDRPGDPNVVGHTGSCFQAVVETEDGKHPVHAPPARALEHLRRALQLQGEPSQHGPRAADA